MGECLPPQCSSGGRDPPPLFVREPNAAMRGLGPFSACTHLFKERYGLRRSALGVFVGPPGARGVAARRLGRLRLEDEAGVVCPTLPPQTDETTGLIEADRGGRRLRAAGQARPVIIHWLPIARGDGGVSSHGICVAKARHWLGGLASLTKARCCWALPGGSFAASFLFVLWP